MMAAALVDRVETRIRSYGAARAVVAFSGGVDSATTLALAARALGDDAVEAVTAVSPSYPRGELEEARRLAASLGVAHRTVRTREVEDERYARNDAMRCFHCKTELYSVLGRLSRAAAADTVLMSGANADDAADFRPGLRAAELHRVRSPLLEEGIGKEEVRAIARHLALPVADKPALACLSSRVAYGVRVTPELLARIDRAEQAVRLLGFDQVRVRHFGDRAVIEVPAEDVGRLSEEVRLPVLRGEIQTLGWAEVSIDPEGYRPGRMNLPVVAN